MTSLSCCTLCSKCYLCIYLPQTVPTVSVCSTWVWLWNCSRFLASDIGLLWHLQEYSTQLCHLLYLSYSYHMSRCLWVCINLDISSSDAEWIATWLHYFQILFERWLDTCHHVEFFGVHDKCSLNDLHECYDTPDLKMFDSRSFVLLCSIASCWNWAVCMFAFVCCGTLIQKSIQSQIIGTL